MGALLVHHLHGGLDQALAFLLSWHLLDLLCKSWLVNLQRKYISAESRLSRGEIRKCLETRLVPEVGIQEASHLVLCCTFPSVGAEDGDKRYLDDSERMASLDLGYAMARGACTLSN